MIGSKSGSYTKYPGRDLDPVPSGLEAVQEEALRDPVLRRRRLDGDARVDEDVGGAQALLAGVDPEREVVQAAGRAYASAT